MCRYVKGIQLNRKIKSPDILYGYWFKPGIQHHFGLRLVKLLRYFLSIYSFQRFFPSFIFLSTVNYQVLFSTHFTLYFHFCLSRYSSYVSKYQVRGFLFKIILLEPNALPHLSPQRFCALLEKFIFYTRQLFLQGPPSWLLPLQNAFSWCPFILSKKKNDTRIKIRLIGRLSRL